MLRAVCSVVSERPAARRDPLRVLRAALSSAAPSQTVLSSPIAPPPPPAPSGGPTPPPSQHGGGGGREGPRRAWPTTAAVALAVTASLGGAYIWNKKQSDAPSTKPVNKVKLPESPSEGRLVPAVGSAFPAHVQYLVCGGGTAAFAALRALRAHAPAAHVLVVGRERALPYMRPPLSKELWREPDLAQAEVDKLEQLMFTQWNGRRRGLVYEPEPFYTPLEELVKGEGAASLARGWTVSSLDVANKKATLTAPGQQPVTVSYDACLIATGSIPRRVAALAAAAGAGRSLALRTAGDALAIARAVDSPAVSTVTILGGGFLACELACALSDRLASSGKRVVVVMPEQAPMAAVLPAYLQEEAARRLEAQGVRLVRGAEVHKAVLSGDSEAVSMSLSNGETLQTELVIEAVGAEPDVALAAASGLELHPQGGVMVNAELAARAGVWAAGDAACYHDVMLGRRREQHHDHAVLTGRLAGENMAAANNNGKVKPYDHQSMFWSDLGPHLGYEAIGVVDARLHTVGVFSADAVTTDAAHSEAQTGSGAAVASDRAEQRRYARGVVFYMRDARVVGVLLWNLFNRMHVARQVLARGEFDDLLEVGKLFAPHEEE